MSIKEHFDNIFANALASSPNVLHLCREKRRVHLHKLDIATAQALGSWTLVIVMHLARILARTQSKYDYAPKSVDARMSTAFGLWEPEKKTMTMIAGGQQVTVTQSDGNNKKEITTSTGSSCLRIAYLC